MLFTTLYRPCYFTADSTNKKSDFVKCLNSSFKAACLQCSFSDKELGEYIQFRKRKATKLPRKYAVEKVGLQPDGSWVMGSMTHLSSTGEILDEGCSQYIWIGHVYNGPGVALDCDQCSIELPLTTDPLCSLFESLRIHMQHNFLPCVMTISATVLALHYQSVLKKLKFCPIPLAFGNSATGKTTALLCGLSLLGAQESRFFSKITKEKMLQMCSSSSIPLGVDDPQSKNDISRLIIDLYNGAKSGTMGYGERKPTSTCVISANFTTIDQQRSAKASTRYNVLRKLLNIAICIV